MGGEESGGEARTRARRRRERDDVDGKEMTSLTRDFLDSVLSSSQNSPLSRGEGGEENQE